MSYPNYPNNRLIVNGVDLSSYGLVLVDGYSEEPPEPKTYTVDIPGGNGVIDLTEALSGEPVYTNRKQKYTFYAIGTENFWKLKTTLMNFLHGKSFDYKITMDPEYTYHGRFTVTGYTHGVYDVGIVGVIEISIDADPYKRKANITQVYNSSTGIITYPVSGRKTVQPRFEFSDDTVIVFNGTRYEMPKGTYTLNNVWFREGQNGIFFMSKKATSHITNGEMKRYSYNQIRTQKPIFEWYKGITKYFVKTLTLKPNGQDISGLITFVATDGLDSAILSTIDLGEHVMRSQGDVCDYLEIEGDSATFVRWISNRKGTYFLTEDTTPVSSKTYYYWENTSSESGESIFLGVWHEDHPSEFSSDKLYYEKVEEDMYVVDDSPTRFSIEYAQIFSNEAQIKNISHNTTGSITYTIDDMNVEKVFINAKHEHYKEGSTHAMTHADMRKFRISQLYKIDPKTETPYEIKEEAVYLDYEWSDL